jgi:hypothetical protein
VTTTTPSERRGHCVPTRKKRVGCRLCLRINQANYYIGSPKYINQATAQCFLAFVVRHPLFSTSNARINVMPTLRVLLLFFCTSPVLCFSPCTKNTRKDSLVLSSWSSPLHFPPRTDPTLYATTILMTAAVFCHSQVDP